MATLSVQDLDISTGLTPSFSSVNSSDEYANEGRTYLHVKNGGGSTITVTITAQVTSVDDSQLGRISISNRTFTVASGAERIVPFLSTAVYNNASGRVAVGYSSTTSVTAAAVRCPVQQP